MRLTILLLAGGGRLTGLAKQEAAVGDFFDEAALFQFFQHAEKGAAVVFLEAEATGKVFQKNGPVLKL